jgi:hypothetical protein
MKLKKLAFQAIEATLMLSITFAIINVAAFFYLKRNVGVDIYDPDSYSSYKDRSLILNGKDTLTLPSLVHPFFGKMEFGNKTYNSELSSEPLFARIDQSKAQKDVKVLILGGSVAMNTSSYHNEGAFAKKLNEYFHTDAFSVYNAAFGGGKQPSQYFKLMYLDLLGFKPDIVINIDGFNEIALPLSENYLLGNPPIFPRSYSAHIDSTSNYARSCVKTRARLVGSGSLFPLIALGIEFYAKRCKSNLEKIEMPWWRPLLTPGDLETYVKQSRLIWQESSNKIEEFTTSREIDYIHVLQPNQYYPNSKIFSDYEKQNVLNFPLYGDPIRNYYHLLTAEGLRAKNFYDQRMALQNIDKTMYEDFCCHFNHDGNAYIVEDIVKKFSPIFEKRLMRVQ